MRDQVFAFRDSELSGDMVCPITGERLIRESCAVDHVPPDTFDVLLFRFCADESIDPTCVAVGSDHGVIAVLLDQELLRRWQAYHLTNAKLRILSRTGNLQLPKPRVDWSELIG